MPSDASIDLQEVVILDAVRTPIGRYGGALSTVRPDDLAAHVISALLDRVPAARGHVQEVVLGATNQAGEDNRNVARMAALVAGLPYETTGLTVNRLCGSGLEALAVLGRAIRLGEVDVGIAGGVESMSRAPYVIAKPSEPFARGAPALFDTALGWRFANPRLAARFPLLSMGETAENVAARYSITRNDQDAFAYQSHQRASNATRQGLFSSEIVSVTTPASRKLPAMTIEQDESIRPDTTLETLGRLKPVFRQGGSVTAGNSSPLNDGAAALLVASEAWARAAGAPILGRIAGCAVAGVDPNYMGIGPVPAVNRALNRTALPKEEVGLWEINEAFAAQTLACIRELGIDETRVNTVGGALALGHPIGCSGARIATTLLYRMGATGARYGIAAACIGVGQGIAVVLEKLSHIQEAWVHETGPAEAGQSHSGNGG